MIIGKGSKVLFRLHLLERKESRALSLPVLCYVAMYRWLRFRS
ncbi:hypothetical protein OROGR_014817 [Orobanche gracilis]